MQKVSLKTYIVDLTKWIDYCSLFIL